MLSIEQTYLYKQPLTESYSFIRKKMGAHGVKKSKKIIKLKLLRRKLALRNLPITVKLFLCFGFFMLFFIIMSFGNYTYYKSDKQKAVLETVVQYNNQAITKIDDYIKDLNTITKYPLIRTTRDSEFLNSMENFYDHGVRNLNFSINCEYIFDEIQDYKKNIQSVYIYNSEGLSEFKMFASAKSADYNPKNEKWFSKSIENYGKPVIVSTYQLPHVTDLRDNPMYVFSMVRAIVKLPPRKVIGIIQVNTKVTFFEEICSKMLISPGQRIAIVDDSGHILYDTEKANIAKKLEEDIWQTISNTDAGSSSIAIDNSKYLINYNMSKSTNWKIVNIIPVAELNKGIDKMAQNTVILTSGSILAALLLIILISRQIVRPIKKLMLLMKIVQKGDFNVKIRLRSRDEIGVLANAFNTMSNKIRRLIQEVYIDKLKEKELELQLLQNQINPHFLYNSLDAINMMADINNDTETSKMAMALAKILRYSVSKSNHIVKISEEVLYIKEYILLQKIRFSDIYQIRINVDPDILEYTTIKLILQPLVENAINHGVYSLDYGGCVDINGYREDSNIVFEVIDNGKGMDKSKVDSLNGYINDLNNSFKSIGLKNVNKRIKLHYGDNYGIIIKSEMDKGTCIRAIIPCIESV